MYTFLAAARGESETVTSRVPVTLHLAITILKHQRSRSVKLDGLWTGTPVSLN